MILEIISGPVVQFPEIARVPEVILPLNPQHSTAHEKLGLILYGLGGLQRPGSPGEKATGQGRFSKMMTGQLTLPRVPLFPTPWQGENGILAAGHRGEKQALKGFRAEQHPCDFRVQGLGSRV